MNWAALAIGGFIGAILRYEASSWIVHLPHAFPAATLLINWSGCLVLGWLFTLTSNGWNIHPSLRLGVGTGFIGSFTTFSTFSVETISLCQQGDVGVALLYVLFSVVGGCLLTALGWKLALIQAGRRREGLS
ncbi:MAG: crcB [Bacilli bacterium]|nr:crcB [Bacilli bacterium]